MKVWYSINKGNCLVKIDYFVKTEEGTHLKLTIFRKRLNKKKWRPEYIFSYGPRTEEYTPSFLSQELINKCPSFDIP